MLRNYLKVALRNLWRSKGFTAINIIGLAAGLGVCLLIVLYVIDERSYDRYNDKAGRIYRISADIYFNNTSFQNAVTPKLLGPTLVSTYPRFLQMARLHNPSDILIKKGNDRILEHHQIFADSTIFKVFSFPFIAGDPNTALNDPHSIVIDESAARRYFNGTDVVGRTLETGSDNTILKVTGVIRDMPEQSHFHFSFIRPLRDTYNDDGSWLSNNYYTYVLVRPGTSPAEVQKAVDATINTNVGGELQQLLHASIDDLNKTGGHFRYPIMALTDIHLNSHLSGELEPNSNALYIYIFSVIAGLILLIACVNFMNLSTARSASRAKEVGIRKVAGSTQRHLIVQFLTESMLLSLFSLILALGIAVLLLPLFNNLAAKQLHPGMLFSMRFLPILVALALLVGCIAGSYPAFYLSSFQPIKVLKGKMAAGMKSSMLRSVLVVGQFVISIGLIVCTIVIYRQLNYIRNKEIGFNRDQVLVVHGTGDLGMEGVATFRKELLSLGGISDVTITSDLPTVGGGQYDAEGWFRDASLDAKKVLVMTTLFVDDHYVPTLGMQMVKGRNFNLAQFPTDSSAIIINEAAARLLAVKDPVGVTLWRPWNQSFQPKPFRVIGVVKNFNYNSMKDQIGPLILDLDNNSGSVAARFNTNDIFGLVRQVESKFHGIKEGIPFNYTFMDDDFNKLYHTEQQRGQIFITFAIFAIFIACLGLFGLVTYAAEQRMKEISIRKVLGARIGGIVGLLSRDFALLITIAALIAFPLAWWLMHGWLQTFAYRTGITWWIFLVAGATALAIALLTVSIQTIRAAVANPIKSLRSE
ncbi:MAG TPA: ABC transporter permease [Puia sp.]|jgi:putative ABC transport system permease protein|nr:ABC transporter permease [Puia sp.]